MLFLSNSGNSGFCYAGNHWKLVRQRGKLSERPYNESGSFKSGKTKIEAAITRQLNELVGRIAGVSEGIEPRSLTEIGAFGRDLRKPSKYWNLWTLYQKQ